MLRSLVSILLLVLSVSVSAQTVSYDYIQASFGRVDFDSNNFDADGDGLGFSASFSIDDDFHVFGQYQTADLSFGVDINILELGGGYHTEISRNLNLSANVGYLEINGSGIGSADADGLFVGLGLRGAVSEVVELYGGLDYIDFDEADGETRANAGSLLALNERLGVGIEANLWDDVNIFQLHARYYFE